MRYIIKGILLVIPVFLTGYNQLLRAQQASSSTPLSVFQQARLRKAIVALEPQYDSTQRMVQMPFSSPGYATRLKGGQVHSTLESLKYAAALLDAEDEKLRPRAFAILNQVVDLQDQNPASKTYGTWSWFLEEPLSQMAPPDLNWADFCATQLLEVVLNHAPDLPADLAAKLKTSIIHAARSIQRRNVTLAYTNIAIMGTFVTLVASELYQLSDLKQYALQRLQLFYSYTMANGAFTEYNSPNYTVVALNELARLKKYVKDKTASEIADQLYMFTWKDIAEHFHAPSRQWAGPHSRSYSSLLNTGIIGILQRATGLDLGYENPSPSLDEFQVIHHCPINLIPYFTQLASDRQLVKTIYKPSSEGFSAKYAQLRPGGPAKNWIEKSADSLPPTLVTTTYLHPAFSLGTANYSDFWNQRRALIAYWGGATAPAYMHVRFLHNNYDFSAAQFFSVQDKGQALAGVCFATNGGDTHIVLDPLKNASFRATDLRLRFEFGGAIQNLIFNTPTSLQQPAVVNLGGILLYLTVPYATINNYQGRWESGKDKNKAWLDVILYSGDEQTFYLDKLDKAGLGLSVQFSQNQPNTVQVDSSSNQLSLQLSSLRLKFPVKPSTQLKLQKLLTVSK